MSCQLHPTVVPRHPFDVNADVENLRNALKGCCSTDENTIINIITKRSQDQRLQIAQLYKTLYGQDLMEEFSSELSGNFKNVILSLMTPLIQYYALELQNAVSGLGTNERTLIDILCTLKNHEIRAVKAAYEKMYKTTLEEDIKDDTSGQFKRLLVSLLCANRDESHNINICKAREDAQKLFRTGEQCLGTDKSVFNTIMATRNYHQLNQIFKEYLFLTGNTIENAIEAEFSGDIKHALLAIVKYAQDRPAFFAERLYKSMKGLGTDNKSLIRIIVSRSEIDLAEIKIKFRDLYEKSLKTWIKEDCSGNYRNCLLAIIDIEVTF